MRPAGGIDLQDQVAAQAAAAGIERQVEDNVVARVVDELVGRES